MSALPVAVAELPHLPLSPARQSLADAIEAQRQAQAAFRQGGPAGSGAQWGGLAGAASPEREGKIAHAQLVRSRVT